jgi:hypothetical protein
LGLGDNLIEIRSKWDYVPDSRLLTILGCHVAEVMSPDIKTHIECIEAGTPGKISYILRCVYANQYPKEASSPAVMSEDALLNLAYYSNSPTLVKSSGCRPFSSISTTFSSSHSSYSYLSGNSLSRIDPRSRYSTQNSLEDILNISADQDSLQ